MLWQSTCKLLSTLFVNKNCINIHHTKPALNNTANTAGVNKTGEVHSKIHLQIHALKSQCYHSISQFQYLNSVPGGKEIEPEDWEWGGFCCEFTLLQCATCGVLQQATILTRQISNCTKAGRFWLNLTEDTLSHSTQRQHVCITMD